MCGQYSVDYYTPGGYTECMNTILKKRAIRRLKIVSGQIRGLERMITEEEYCINIIRQSLAAKEALSSIEDLILRNHLTTHVAEQMQSGKKAKAVEEMLSVYRLSKRK